MTPSTSWNEILSLLHISIGQSQVDDFVDLETLRFFASPAGPKAAGLKKESQSRPVTNRQSVQQHSQKTTPKVLHTDQHTLPQDHAVDEEALSENSVCKKTGSDSKDKLLPSPSLPHYDDLSSTLKQMKSLANMPKFSDYHLYDEPPHPAKPWTIFTLLAGEAPKETFIQAVVQAIEGRLKIKANVQTCSEETFTADLQLASSTSDCIVIFCSHHLISSLQKMIDVVPGITKTVNAKEPPFLIIGSLNHKPLRLFELSATTHQDSHIKQQLWQRLKQLACPPPTPT